MELIKFLVSKRVHQLLTGLFLLTIAGCSKLALKPTDFAWPVESVLKIDEQGNVIENRNSLVFNTKNIFFEETGDSLAYRNKNIRLIRDMSGYYYITSDNFKNVYVFENGEGKLTLEDKILITETGIQDPAFNQRQPFIELLAGDKKFLLTNDGISNNNEINDKITSLENKNEK